MKGDCDLNKHTLVRGFFLSAIFILFGILELEQGYRPAAAEADLSAAYAQYLPITIAESCIPRPLILPGDPEKDLAVENGINTVRANHGLPALNHSAKIAQAALRHSNDMAANNLEGHIGSDGSNPGDRLNDACYRSLAYGEIIAGGYRTPAEVIAAWMGSPGHADIILSNEYTEFGAAYAYNKNSTYKHYYTVDFALRDTTATLNVGPGDYNSCSFSIKDESGESWLNLYSLWPCEKFLSDLVSTR